jgi:hypothetical protein
MNADQFAQNVDDSSGANASGYVDRQALARELIHDRQALELLPIGTGIEHEVIGPHLAHGHCRQWPWAASRHTAPGPFPRHLQLMQAPKAMGPIRAHGMSTPSQEDLDAPISVPRILRRELVHHGCHRPAYWSQSVIGI